MTFTLTERDLDLIQLEELHSNRGYATWFANRVGLEGWRFESARHSVMAQVEDAWGETDLLAYFALDAHRTAVLIEDKIAAAFTDRQAERYQERGQALVQAGECHAYKAVLVAPARYLASVPLEAPWQVRIPIEEITEWFEACEGSHAAWRVTVLRGALARLTRAATPDTEDVARFSLALAEHLARHYAPALSHNPGRDRSGPIIRFPGSSASKTLWWKFATSQMTLQLMGDYQGLVEHLDLPFGVDLELAREHGRKCDYLVAAVPPVDPSLPFAEQRSTVERAIEAALRLLAMLPQIEGAAAGIRRLANP